MAEELLCGEIELLSIILSSSNTNAELDQKPIKWHGSQTDLVELIYALYHSKCFGDYLLKDVVSFFETVFDFSIGNYSHIFGRLRCRKSNRCSFLNRSIHNLKDKMDELDR